MAKRVSNRTKEETGRCSDEHIQLSRLEALDVIARLTALLAGEALPMHSNGACPEVAIQDRGVVVHRIFLSLTPPKEPDR